MKLDQGVLLARIVQLESENESYRLNLAKAINMINTYHAEDCMDADDKFGPNETCECEAISRQNFIKEARAALETK